MNIFNEYFHEQYVYSFKGGQQSSDCVIFFHGFPGNVSKNEDLAKATAQEFSVDTYAVHFGGLGKSKGKFAFGQSYSTTLNYVLQMSRRYKRVHLVGHSWGGFVATKIACAPTISIESLALISPLTVLPPTDDVTRAVLSAVLANRQHDLGEFFDLEQAVLDVAKLRADESIFEAVSRLKIANGVMLIQAKNDPEVSEAHSEKLFNGFVGCKEYKAVEQDHSFSDRGGLIALLTNWYRDNHVFDTH